MYQGTGQYKVKTTGETVTYDFEYEQYTSIEQAVEVLGAVKVLKDLNRIVKLDANNPARESAKVSNGHSERKPMSEADKLKAKAERAIKVQIVEACKAGNFDLVSKLTAQLSK